MTASCNTCRFHHTIDFETEAGVADKNHFCRFDPPEFIPPNSSALKPVLPIGWCGKHEPKRRAKS